jgi:Holliday junction resolvasome RuvABC endonuclease subunit
MSVVSLCLGLDVSPKRLGWALARLEDGAPVACGMEAIELPANGWDLGRIYAAVQVVDFESEKRLAEIHYVAIERPALPPKSGTNAAFNAGRAYQEAVSAVRRRWPWAVLDEMQPAEWRRLAGLKGNASKIEVQELVNALLGWGAKSQDAADAACIALAGVERNRQTLATPSGQAAQ